MTNLDRFSRLRRRVGLAAAAAWHGTAVAAPRINADVAALSSSDLAETNEAAVTLAFLEAWAARAKAGLRR